MLALSSCEAAPTTTYTNADGQEVTVSWRDYPAHGYSNPEEILLAPSQEDTEAISGAILEEIKAAITADFGTSWTAEGTAEWFPRGGNGYGGDDMTVTYNSVRWNSDSAPVATADWERILRIVDGVTAKHGLGTVKLSPDSSTIEDDPAWRKELIDKYGTADIDKLYWWSGSAYANSQWLSFSITNVDRDGTGQAAKEYESTPALARSISLDYGVTTLAEADVPAFKESLAPFAGLTRPVPSSSD